MRHVGGQIRRMDRESSGVRTVRWISVILVLFIIGLALFASTRNDKEREQKSPLYCSVGDIAICAGRLGSLGASLRMYAADYDGAFPILQTPLQADRLLVSLLDTPGVTRRTLRCPARPQDAYIYHCYHRLGDRQWPKWMDQQRTIATNDSPETWIASDILLRGSVGPHSETTKMFNFLRIDGSVQFSAAQPRTVYE